VTNRDVDIFAREVDMLHSRRDSEVNPRVSLHKPRKPMHKPFCGKIGRGADRKDARGLSLHQALGSDGEAIKRVPHDREILATRFRYDQALAFAIEQLDPSSASILRLLWSLMYSRITASSYPTVDTKNRERRSFGRSS